jgi:cytochrome c oxidase cbb3-type subunit 1
MWVAGIMQGLMWRAYNEFGFLEYAFSEVVPGHASLLHHPGAGRPALPRGHLIMAFNLWKTSQRRAVMAPRRRRSAAGGCRMSHAWLEKNLDLLLIGIIS